MIAANNHSARLRLGFSNRAVRIAASAPKKQKLASECPLGKLYDSGGSRSKNGVGRARLNANFRVMFRIAAPSMVAPNSNPSRFSFFEISQKTITIVAIVKKIDEPMKESPRIAEVIAGDANW